MSKPLPIGTKVVDRDGFKGTIRNITYHSGSFWYDVRFERGEAVRFADDLTIEQPAITDAEFDGILAEIDTSIETAAQEALTTGDDSAVEAAMIAANEAYIDRFC